MSTFIGIAGTLFVTQYQMNDTKQEEGIVLFHIIITVSYHIFGKGVCAIF